MKKFSALLVIVLVLIAQVVLASDTFVKCSASNTYDNCYVWTATMTSDASGDASETITAAEAAKITGWYIYQVVTNPAASTDDPTDDWDVTMQNSDGVADLLGGQCMNRDSVNSETCYPVTYYFVDGTLTLTGDNMGDTNKAVVKVFFVK